MLYDTVADWRGAAHKRVLLFGMSGLGKTRLASLLRETGDWFHYSVDYRIGTRYMGEHIADLFKREAMQVPVLRELLMSDSISIESKIRFHNLAPLSTYLGKPGDPAKGGLPFDEYMRRQEEHRAAEIAAMQDTARFIERGEAIYGYPHFICDSSGSFCEVVDPWDPEDPLLRQLEESLLLVWIEGTEAHTEALIRRFDRAPKPMYYQPEFLRERWAAYLAETGLAEDRVDPDAFVRWAYAQALAHRAPRYRALAARGVTVQADEVARVADAADFEALIARALETRGE
ncbi:ATPase [Rhodosalinus sediminis]|uniref:ATPase n=1 Tax=Rhodosalinus sediminis TaxID=1940533 RepID=A0A3D9BW52_9RHOB|nr:ATPase [Rhodosalinus sediminis]REC57626.1 ATPase [Rhodosalinus sediminis]